MAVSVKYAFKATGTETLSGNTDSASSARRKVIHDQFDESGTLSATTTPPVTKMAEAVVALVAAAKTIDLTNLTGTNGAAVDLTGLKPQIIRIKNLGANKMTFKSGASNGHTGVFTATTGQEVQPGGVIQILTNDTGDDVDGTHKTWDVTGTGTQTFELSVFGG